MPYIDIRITKTVDATSRDKLQTKIARIMELIPGKNAGNTTICISDNYTMYKNNLPIEAAFIDVRLFKESPTDSKRAFAKSLFSIFENELGLPPSKVQMNFVELPCWAANGDLI